MSSHPAYIVDGLTAGRRAARLQVSGDDLVILLDEGREVLRWPLGDIRGLRDQASSRQITLRLETAPGAAPNVTAGSDAEARLVVTDAATIEWILRVCPALQAQSRDPKGARRLLFWAIGAVASFVLLLFVVIPGLAGWLAPLVPTQTAEALGQQVRGQAAALLSSADPEARYCTDATGMAALQAMSARLTRDAPLPYDLHLAVVDSEVVNAFAAPGGHVVVLRGLIDEAGDAEEVAAVLAHEIGHVAARDPMRAAMRSAGSAGLLGLALGDFVGGGVVATVTTQLIDAHYSRAAERDADVFAAGLLTRAGVSPDALARFFERLAASREAGPMIPPYFASHPPLETRSAALREAGTPARDRPILSPAEWRSLQDICRRRGAAPGA